MAPIAREPGQKGVNWSNIAVGEQDDRILIPATKVLLHRCYHEYGAVLLSSAGVRSLMARVHRPM